MESILYGLSIIFMYILYKREQKNTANLTPLTLRGGFLPLHSTYCVLNLHRKPLLKAQYWWLFFYRNCKDFNIWNPDIITLKSLGILHQEYFQIIIFAFFSVTWWPGPFSRKLFHFLFLSFSSADWWSTFSMFAGK